MPERRIIRLSVSADPNTNRFEILPGCPANPNGDKSLFCPNVRECELDGLVVVVRAASMADAVELAQIASAVGEVPTCQAGREYTFRDPEKNYQAHAWADSRAFHRAVRRSLDR